MPDSSLRRCRIAVWPALFAMAGCSSPSDVVHDGSDGALDDTGDADGGFVPPPPLTDDQGRAVYYVGVNVAESSKQAADFLPPLTDDDYARLAGWGVTLVRLLIFWEAIEPARGVWDERYLAAVRGELDRLQAHGFDVLLDMHQDVFGRGFGFAGAPRWACDEANYATFRPQEPWFMNYFTEEVKRCFDAFWNDRTLWDEYRAAWRLAAAHLADHPAVIGADLMNEPFSGSLTGAAFELDDLAPFYADIAAAFDGLAVRPRLFVEPSVAYDFEPRTYLPEFLVPQVFVPHYYPTFASSGIYAGHEADVAADLRDMAGDAAHLGGPFVLGEFGLANDAADGPSYLAALVDGALAVGGSAVVWDFSRGDPGAYALLDPVGHPYPLAEALRRPYVHRLAGRLISTTYDRRTRTVEATWEETGNAAPTIIATPYGVDCPDTVITSPTDSESSYDITPAGAGRAAITVSPDIRVHTFRITLVCPGG